MNKKHIAAAILVAGLLAIGPLNMGRAQSADPVPASVEEKLGADYVRPPATQFWIDDAQLVADVTNTGQVHLPFGVLATGVTLAPHELRAPGAKAFAVGADGLPQEVSVPSLGTYRGYLTESPLQAAVFTIVPDFVHGLVHDVTGTQHILSIDTPLPAQRNAEGQLLVEVREAGGSDSADKEIGGTDPTVGAIPEYTTLPIEEQNLGVAAGWERPTTSIFFDAITHSDGEFYNAGTSTVWSRQATNFNDADSHFYAQLRVGFSLAQQWTFLVNNQPTSATSCSTLRQDFENRMDTDLPISSNPRDFMVFFVQRDLSGGTIGCAWEPGIHNPDDLGYAVVQTYSLNTDEEQEVTMHEIGHLFHGEHQYAKEWRDSGCFWLCKKGTIMIDEGLGNLFEFSEGDDFTYNAYRVRYCADHVSSCSSMASPAKGTSRQYVL